MNNPTLQPAPRPATAQAADKKKWFKIKTGDVWKLGDAEFRVYTVGQGALTLHALPGTGIIPG